MTSSNNKNGEAPEFTEPLDSSTVILIRDLTGGGIETFLMRRHMGQKFMGGAYVFPGGKLDDEDCDPDLFQMCTGIDPEESRQLLQEPDMEKDVAMALFLAAVRETFEESGVLLAYSSDGSLVKIDEDGACKMFEEYRSKVHSKESSLKEMAEEENLHYALDMLVPYSRWITPQAREKRFDTRFFVAAMPPDQTPSHCSIEMTDSLWSTPAGALEKHKEGDIFLMPPTLKSLEDLANFASTADVLSAARDRTIYPILPQPFGADGSFGIMLPHDPDYSIEGYKQPTRPEMPSRLIMRDGKWHNFEHPPEG